MNDSSSMINNDSVLEWNIDFEIYDNPEFGMVTYDLVGDFSSSDSWAFYRGKKISPELVGARLYRQKGDRGKHLPDCIDTSVGWLLCSRKLVGILSENTNGDSLQWLTPLVHEASKDLLDGYKLLNVLELVSCMDMGQSSYKSGADGSVSSVEFLALREPENPPSGGLFRLSEWPVCLLAPSDLAQTCISEGCSGIVWNSCRKNRY